MTTQAYIGLGSNQSDRQAHLSAALADLASLPGVTLITQSPTYETDPVGGPAGQGRFLNSAAAVNTDLTAPQLLEALNKIEITQGRPPQDQRVYQGPRTLDLDILLFGNEILGHHESYSNPQPPTPNPQRPTLTIPHPRMHQRYFVLKPLCDIAPDAVHPILKRTIRELLVDLKRPAT